MRRGAKGCEGRRDAMRDTRVKFLVFLFSAVLLITSGCERRPAEADADQMVLRHVLYSRVSALDPANVRDTYSRLVVSQIFEPLYDYHFLKRPYQLVPALAESEPQISEDKLVYTIKIKKGVYFQDDDCFPQGIGRELEAEDFIFSLKRIADIKNLSPNWTYLDNRIVGLDEFREYTKTCRSAEDVDYSRNVEGLSSRDEYTLVIKLKKPWPQVVHSIMANTVFAPVAREAVDYYGDDIISHPVGTGAFKLSAWRRGSYIELVRNGNFRKEVYPSRGEAGDAEAGYLDDAGRAIPFADKVVWTIIEEYRPTWLLFMQGRLDASVIPKDNYDEVMAGSGELTEAMKQRNIHLKTFRDPSTHWLGFNMADEVLGPNKALRRAISHAIDREKFIELFFNNRHLVAHGLIPPMMPSYNRRIKEKGYSKYDPEKARELLRQAEEIYGGKIPGLKIAMPGTDTFYRQFGQFLKRNLNAIGLEVEVQYTDRPTYQERLNAGKVQMFASGQSAGIPDAQDFLSLFRSRNGTQAANGFNYSNAKFDQLYEQAQVMSDSPQRRRLYRQMELIVLEDCPAAFLNHRVAYVLCHDWYKNYKPHAFAYGLSKYRRIDRDKRSAYKELAEKSK